MSTKVRSEVRARSASGGQKGRKLARFALVPFDALWAVAEHFGKGASKYADRNWERGYQWSWSADALQRHFAAFWQGEDHGEEKAFGKFLHITAVAWHALVLLAFQLRGIGIDDRPKRAKVQEGRS